MKTPRKKVSPTFFFPYTVAQAIFPNFYNIFLRDACVSKKLH